MFITDVKKESLIKEDKYEIGEAFAVPVSAIEGLHISGYVTDEYKLNKFQLYFDTWLAECISPEVRDMYYKVKNSYILLSYIGNGKFVEYFSRKNINLFEKKEYDPESFIKEYRKIVDEYENDEEKKNLPLFIVPERLEPITGDIKTNIINSNKKALCEYFDVLSKETI